MHGFKDNAGREWSIAINIRTAEILKQAIPEFDLIDDPKSLQKVDDTYFVYRVVWELCKTQAQAAGVTEDQFADAFNGEGVEKFTAELLDFFRRFHRQAEAALLEKALKAKEQTTAMAMEKMGRIDQVIQTATARSSAEIDKAIEAAGNQFGSLQASPA